MNVSDFDYHLPPELIAQEPIEPRDSSRLMVIDRQKNTIKHRRFRDVLEYLSCGDCLVVNDARVLPARLYGKKAETGGRVEFLLLSEVAPRKWEVLVKPGRKSPPGAVVNFDEGILTAVVEKRISGGKRQVLFEYEGDFREILNKVGEVPLPPYIHSSIENPNRYQTVYASKEGAVAAPTAGLHFTEELLEEVKNKGVTLAPITLDVGLDSFRPVRVLQVEAYKMHSEKFSVSSEAANLVNDAIERSGRILAVGTTSARVLETVAVNNRQVLRPRSGQAKGEGSFDNAQDKRRTVWKVKAMQGKTELFIYPGYEFKILDALLTNFHLPKSTLLMLVCAFASRDLIVEAYQQAIEHKYRFFSFGDAMLII